jgi:hypothetical protein
MGVEIVITIRINATTAIISRSENPSASLESGGRGRG